MSELERLVRCALQETDSHTYSLSGGELVSHFLQFKLEPSITTSMVDYLMEEGNIANIVYGTLGAFRVVPGALLALWNLMHVSSTGK